MNHFTPTLPPLTTLSTSLQTVVRSALIFFLQTALTNLTDLGIVTDVARVV